MSENMRRTGYARTIALAAVLLVAIGLGAYYLSLGKAPGAMTEERPRQVPGQAQAITLNGAGATFPFPLLSKMSKEYEKVNPSVRINYQSIGSGGGIRQHTVKTVDFAASDAPLTDEEFRKATGTLHLPFTIGPVVPTYNVPGIPKGLRFTGEVLADIFLGRITKWNDDRIQVLNPGVTLPNKEIVVVHRSDGSGTTYVWTNYLSNISEEWRTKVGKGTSVNWPVGLGGKGNEGVAGLVAQNPYSIGYNEFAYAKLNNMAYGSVRNAAGKFVEPSLETAAAAAAAAAVALPRGDQSWSKVSIIDQIVKDTRTEDSYPITSFSYFLVFKELNIRQGMDREKARALVEFLWWAVHDGQKFAPDLVYVPLPPEVVRHNEETLRMITFNGEPILK